jgi:hypothetical protein
MRDCPDPSKHRGLSYSHKGKVETFVCHWDQVLNRLDITVREHPCDFERVPFQVAFEDRAPGELTSTVALCHDPSFRNRGITYAVLALVAGRSGKKIWSGKAHAADDSNQWMTEDGARIWKKLEQQGHALFHEDLDEWEYVP